MFRTLSLSLPILAFLFAAPLAVAQSDFAGDWSGALSTEMGDIDVIFHITEGDAGLAANLDVPQQGATGLAASDVSTEGDDVTIEFADLQITVNGTKNAEGVIDATWSQAEQEVPLTLSRAEAGAFAGEAAEAEAAEEEAPEEEEGLESQEVPEDAEDSPEDVKVDAEVDAEVDGAVDADVDANVDAEVDAPDASEVLKTPEMR